MVIDMRAIEDIQQGIAVYEEQIKQTKEFNTYDFIQYMEPYFVRHGYRTAMPESPRNILIIHDAGVGDFINLSPCLRAILQHYPLAHIVLVLFPRALVLAEACPYVDEVIPNLRQCDWNDFLSLYEWNQGFCAKLLPYHFDLAFVFPHYGSAVQLAYLSGAKVRVAYDISRVQKSTYWHGDIPYDVVVPFINRPVPYRSENVHATDRYLGVLDAFWGQKVNERETEAWCFPKDIERSEEILADWLAAQYPIYSIVMGGEGAFKRWPPEKYAQLIRLLQEDYPSLHFVLLGGGTIDGQEAQRFLQAYEELQGRAESIRNFVGKLSYCESAAVMDKCEAYIGNDTGNMHLAAALDKPILVPCAFAAEFPLGPDDVPRIFAPRQVPAVFIQPVKALPACKPKRSEHGCCQWGEVHCIGQVESQAMRKGFDLLRERCHSGLNGTIYVNQETLL
ncbi:glycosyltransferase family 9 protein [Selenomonas sp. WCA-380-WT-3B 3/]|uniref:Glycosyltransferase family 9 protein n=1 Tax=Selenomonas montiformis TaxID=2652285 RepID=A0A6I2UY54_9FIRM|nr:glycosyltransferase family 9 protein [Selenomonas montiformis]MSV25014.1 glycosyltransferase family 9 protein [Selenomonas montiformis]